MMRIEVNGVLQPLTGALAGLDIPTPQPQGLVAIPGDDPDHQFQAPGPTDVRGVCPTLNALANHGYISRDGITSFAEAANAVQTGYGYVSDELFLQRVTLSNEPLASATVFLYSSALWGSSLEVISPPASTLSLAPIRVCPTPLALRLVLTLTACLRSTAPSPDKTFTSATTPTSLVCEIHTSSLLSSLTDQIL